MTDGTYSALSASDAFSKGMAVVSDNVANIHTDDFKESRAIMQEGQNGGVDISIEKIETPETPVPEEESNAETQGPSNVDLAEEMGQMILTQRGYEANLETPETQEELLGSVLDIVG